MQSDRYNSPLELQTMRRLKGSLQPTLHMDLIDQRLLSNDSIEILGAYYDTTTLDVFILKPPVQLAYLEEMQPRDVQRKQLNRRKATTYEEQFPPRPRLVTHYTVN